MSGCHCAPCRWVVSKHEGHLWGICELIDDVELPSVDVVILGTLVAMVVCDLDERSHHLVPRREAIALVSIIKIAAGAREKQHKISYQLSYIDGETAATRGINSENK